jgi:hypothetical protein
MESYALNESLFTNSTASTRPHSLQSAGLGATNWPFIALAVLCVKDVGVHIGDPLFAILGCAEVAQGILDKRTNRVPIE